MLSFFYPCLELVHVPSAPPRHPLVLLLFFFHELALSMHLVVLPVTLVTLALLSGPDLNAEAVSFLTQPGALVNGTVTAYKDTMLAF